MEKKRPLTNQTAAPGIDEEDSFGQKATQKEIEQGESTPVTRLVYDEYDESEPQDS